MYKKTEIISKFFKSTFGRDINIQYISEIKNQKQEEHSQRIEIDGKSYYRTEIYNDIIDGLSSNMKIGDRNNIHLWTNKVFVMTYKSLTTLVNKYTGDDKKYIRNQYKCGHFAVDFVDYASEVTLNNELDSNLGVGMFAYKYKKLLSSGGHALNWALIIDNNNEINLYVIEPQNGNIWDINKYFEEQQSHGKSDIELILFLML